MEFFLSNYWPHLAAALTGLGALWTLLSRVNRALVSHVKYELGESFATRAQVEKLDEKMDRLDTKINGILERVWRQEGRDATLK